MMRPSVVVGCGERMLVDCGGGFGCRGRETQERMMINFSPNVGSAIGRSSGHLPLAIGNSRIGTRSLGGLAFL